MFVVDDLVSWLVGRLADAGYQKVSTRLRGSEQDRALKQAVMGAVQATAAEISPSDEEQGGQLADLISRAFGERVRIRPPPGQLTCLEALRAGIAGQLSVLDDAGTPTTGLLGVPGSVLADRLTAHLIFEISARGSGGGPLEPLANQLDHDLTHSQLEELKGMVTPPEPAATGKPTHGRPVTQWKPVELGVHQVIGGGPMPVYVRRPHDGLLRAVLDPAVSASRLVVVRGGSSTGKTRTAYEAVADRLADWHLDYPLNVAALRERLEAGIPVRTVLWLGELRQYADADGGPAVLGRVADLLVGEGRLVITTMWPEHWDTYAAAARTGPGAADPAGTAGRLLERLPELTGRDLLLIDPAHGGVIDVPDQFTTADLQAAVGTGDRVLAEAAAAATSAGQDGQVTQYLAGVPDLLRRFAGRGGDPYGQAIITAAMDAARLGHASPLPAALLQEAAVGYLTGSQRTQDIGIWRDTALAWAAEELNGAVRALQPVPPAAGTGVAGYQVADYLDQHGRRTRQDQAGPPSLWDAITTHTTSGGDLLHVGGSALVLGHFDLAVTIYTRALELNPEDAQAWYGQGKAFAGMGDFSRAVESYRASLDRVSDFFWAWYDLGLAQLELGEFAQAATSLQEVQLLRGASDHKTSIALARALRGSGDLTGAYLEYQSALALRPNVTAALRGRDEVLSLLPGPPPEPVGLGAEPSPDDHDLWFKRGNLLLSQGKAAEAARAFRAALASRKNYADAWHGLGLACTDGTGPEDPIACYERALTIDPTYYWAHFDLGNARRIAGDHEAALGHYDSAIRCQREYPDAWYGKGLSLARLGRHGEAVKQYDQALQLEPDFPAISYDRGNSLRELGYAAAAGGDRAAAEDLFRQGADAYQDELGKGDHAGASHGLGLCCIELGSYEEAVDYLGQAIAGDPGAAWYWYDKGRALSACGRHEDAVAAFCRALKLRSPYPQAWYEMARAEAQQGHVSKAVEALESAARLRPERYPDKARTDPAFAAILGDLRFRRLVENRPVGPVPGGGR